MSIKLTFDCETPEQARDLLDVLFPAKAARTTPPAPPVVKVDVNQVAKEAAKNLPEVAPAAEEYLKEQGYDVAEVLKVAKGTGAKGRFLKKDAINYVEAQQGKGAPQVPTLTAAQDALKEMFGRAEAVLGRDGARAKSEQLLGQFGASKVSEVKPDQRESFIKAAGEADFEAPPEDKPEPQQTDIEDAPGPTDKPAGDLTLDDVRAALTAYNDVAGMPACRTLITEFGVGRISDLKQEQYDDFIKTAAQRTFALTEGAV